MLEFRKINVSDYAKAAPAMSKNGFGMVEASFVSLFMWSGLYNAEICIDNDVVFFRTRNEEKTSYLFPFGGETKENLLKILKTERERGYNKVFFHSLNKKMIEEIEAIFPKEFSYEERRNSFDYVYKCEDLATLSGKKLHQKRNHVNKFLKKYEGRFKYCEISKDNISDIVNFQEKWREMASDKEGKRSLDYESDAIQAILADFDILNLLGGVLYVDGEVVAYCIASKICDDTVDVMVEKADYNFTGAYQMINKCFAESMLGKTEYINREDDMGLPGLRTAKLSYNPEFLIEKYGAIWQR